MLRKKWVYIILAFTYSVIMFNLTFAQNNEEKEEKKSSNLSQYYGGKFGFYSADGLNNGLILGIDGITEFNNYNFFLSGDIDLYPKKTISVFNDPDINITDQLILLFPLHVNFGYKLAEVPDADTKFYAGGGVGYYFYIYSFTYQGGFPLVDSRDETKNGGNVFFTIFGRILIGKIFVEPRYYFAFDDEGTVENDTFNIDPTGFLITLGFQY